MVKSIYDLYEVVNVMGFNVGNMKMALLINYLLTKENVVNIPRNTHALISENIQETKSLNQTFGRSDFRLFTTTQ